MRTSLRSLVRTSLVLACVLGVTPLALSQSPEAAPAKPAPALDPAARDLLSPRRPESDTSNKGPSTPVKIPADVAAQTSPTGQVVPNEPPVIEFDPPIADLGELIADTAKTMTIKIKNISKEPIRISRAIPGCGCTTPVWPKDPIAPGASADCEITLKPGSQQGIRMSKNVTFQIENHAPVTLKVEGNVVAYVTMAPDRLDSPPAPGAPGAATEAMTLESTDGVAFKVLEVMPPIVKNLPADAATKHVLKLDWAAWEESGKQMKFTVRTDHPKAPMLTSLVKKSFSNAPTAPEPARAPAGPGTTSLINAVRAGDMSKLAAEIAAGADVNERDRTAQRTALHWAAKVGNRAAMEALFAAKADPNVKDRQGRTPLWSGVEADLETVKLLVDKGADVNARDQIQSSPLLWAAGFGKPETVAFLLGKGADVKATDDNGWTPLIWAAGLGQPMTVDLLVKAGADLAAADKQTGDTPLLRGARTGKADGLKVLVAAGADLKAKNKLGQTALHLAAAGGSPEKVEILLKAGCDPAATDDKGWAAIDHAMNRTTGDKAKLLELLKPVSPAPKVGG
ncbi:MAG: ankyrin repeat domain-containing protein [Planctomycetota bacterium]